MNRLRVGILLMLLTLLLGVILGGCAPSTPSGGDVSHDGIVYYDIAFEMDPAQGVFSSQQRASITGSLAEGRKLSVFLKEGPEIDRLALEDSAGNALAIAWWQPVGSTTSDIWWGQSASTEIEIETVGEIPTEEQLTVSQDYHLPEEAIQAGLAENIYDLFVSTRGSHAGGPESGAFLLVSGNLEAPFSITIRHPDTFLCALP